MPTINYPIFDGTLDIPTAGTRIRFTQKSVTSITAAGKVATVTITSHGYNVGDSVTISGAVESDFNGTFVVQSVPSANTFTVWIDADNPGAATGTIIAYARKPAFWLTVVAKDTNAGKIFIGGNSVSSSSGIYLEPGDSHTFPPGKFNYLDLQHLYADTANNGDDLYYVGGTL